ncbi:MAG: hypothetical protein A2X85_04050 [Geobacteraceae bacterium GWF2_54_21]|nr:MAG: hypothetical protein A2X85_04050 [Geobacteraceae bacterium GWF2_54_21]
MLQCIITSLISVTRNQANIRSTMNENGNIFLIIGRVHCHHKGGLAYFISQINNSPGGKQQLRQIFLAGTQHCKHQRSLAVFKCVDIGTPPD